MLAANLIGMVVQTQSAKLGIATGKNLPELCREQFPRSTSLALWVQAELVAMATDIAEVIGAALGLYLLFGIPLFWAGLIAGAGSFAILALQERGFRKLEALIAGFVGIVIASFVFEVTQSNPDPRGIAEGLFIPGFDGTESVLLAVSILGATVMPHVVYLHSALTQSRVVGRNDAERKRILSFERVDVMIAMTIVLSFGIPFALVPLLIIASRKRVMGAMVNPGWLTAFASVLAAMIIALNLFLLYDLFLG